MNQREIDLRVAAELGESLATVAHRGFVIEHPIPYETEREPLVVDWDALDASR